MTDLAEIDRRIKEAQAEYAGITELLERQHQARLADLYSMRAALEPRSADIGKWLTYRDIARKRNITEPSAEQAVRRARRKSKIAERPVGRAKAFAEDDLVAAGLL